MKHYFGVILLALFLALTGFTNRDTPKITVAVAANMQYAIRALDTVFEKTAHVKVVVVLGSSGNLTQQIMQGAPFDLFISADTNYPRQLYQQNFGVERPKVYAQGVLVLWTTRPDIQPGADGKFLISDKIKAIALANPATAPYGFAAVAFLKKHHLYDQLKHKMVYGENIGQASQFIATGAADVGFTAKAIVVSEQMQRKGSWVALNTLDYPPIKQAALLLKYGQENNPLAARKFYEFLFSNQAKAIFKKFGYILN